MQNKKLTETTIGEYGMKLPVGGISGSGTLIKTFQAKAMKTREEREIARLKTSRETVMRYTTSILAVLLEEMGGVDLKDLKDIDQRKVQIGRFTMADVMYVWTWLRIKNIGPEFPVKFNCGNPHCGKEIRMNADLNSTKVTVAEDPADLIWSYDLEQPAQIRGSEVTRLILGAPHWYGLANTNESNLSAVKIALLRASVTALNEPANSVQLIEADLDDITKRDFEKVVSLMNEKSVGPNMSLEGECPHCGTPFVHSIDWNYQDFFGASSQ